MPTRNVIIDDLDKPNYIPSPQTDPIGYDDGRARTVRRRVPLSWVLFGVGLVFVVVLFVLWQLSAWVGQVYDDNTTFQRLAVGALYVIVISVSLSIAGVALSLAFGAFGRAARAGIVDLPGGLSVHALDLLIGWRRSGVTVMAAETMQRHFAVQDRLAERSQFRNVTSYSPSIHVSTNATELEREDDDTQALLTPPDVPPFSTLLSGNHIGPDSGGRMQPLILGYGDGGAVTGDWRSLYSSGLGGLQGSGKTWTAAFLLAQSALAGARLVVCDPHAGDEESLATRIAPLSPSYLCDVAEDDRAILNALKLADAELQRRKRGHPDRTPIIVALDEWSSLRRGELAELLPVFVEDFSTEGRKLQCHVMLLGQRWDKSSVGDFRNTLASAYVHRMRREEARMMTGLQAAALPADTLQLAPGTAYLLDTRGALQRVSIPFMRPSDVADVGALLQRRESGVKVIEATAETAPGRAEATPEEARILSLFFEAGRSVGEIVREVWPHIKSGTPYNDKRAYVEGLIRTKGK